MDTCAENYVRPFHRKFRDVGSYKNSAVRTVSMFPKGLFRPRFGLLLCVE